MPTIFAPPGGYAANLSTAQAGSGVSTNVVQRRSDLSGRATMLRLVTTVGGGPTCTYLIEGSGDGTIFWPLPNIDLATPGTLVTATFVVVVAATMWRMIPVDIPWTYLRITYSANTNVTNTADVWPY